MIGYDYVINNLNQNLTERENSNKNKSRDENYKKTRHSKVLTGLQINFPNLEHLSKNKINSERNQNIKNSHNRNISENEILSIVLKNNLLNKSKSKSKNKSKIFRIQNIKKRNKFTNSLQTILIEDTSKWKEITKKSNNILDDKKNKKISKEIYSNISCAITSRTRNLKTYNVLFKTNSLEIDKNKINDINNKENQSINKKIFNNILSKNNNNLNNMRNSSGNNYKNSKITHMKKITKKIITKNHTEKTLYDSSFIYNGFKKYSKKLKNK